MDAANPLDLQELTRFLDAANKSTYANKDAAKAPSSRPRSDDYHFEQGNLTYHDTYFGGRDFIGGEIVYKSGTPVWGMNYYGYILDPATSEKEVYNFLRKALMQPHGSVIPVRGPSVHQEGGWLYRNAVDGELDRFGGAEEISLNGKSLYRATYHGGFID